MFDHNDLIGRRAFTVHPAYNQKMKKPAGELASVVQAGHLLTGRGPGSAVEFSTKLVEMIYDADTKAEVEKLLAI